MALRPSALRSCSCVAARAQRRASPRSMLWCDGNEKTGADVLHCLVGAGEHELGRGVSTEGEIMKLILRCDCGKVWSVVGKTRAGGGRGLGPAAGHPAAGPGNCGEVQASRRHRAPRTSASGAADRVALVGPLGPALAWQRGRLLLLLCLSVPPPPASLMKCIEIPYAAMA